MKTCKYCKKKIKGFFRKLFNNFCNDKCESKFIIEKEQEQKKILLQKLKRQITKEKVSNDIKKKYFELNNRFERKYLLMKLINDWKKIQDKRLKIISIETYQWIDMWDGFIDVWRARIIYTFDV